MGILGGKTQPGRRCRRRHHPPQLGASQIAHDQAITISQGAIISLSAVVIMMLCDVDLSFVFETVPNACGKVARRVLGNWIVDKVRLTKILMMNTHVELN